MITKYDRFDIDVGGLDTSGRKDLLDLIEGLGYNISLFSAYEDAYYILYECWYLSPKNVIATTFPRPSKTVTVEELQHLANTMPQYPPDPVARRPSPPIKEPIAKESGIHECDCPMTIGGIVHTNPTCSKYVPKYNPETPMAMTLANYTVKELNDMTMSKEDRSGVMEDSGEVIIPWD
jgi:hypothetical protein